MQRFWKTTIFTSSSRSNFFTELRFRWIFTIYSSYFLQVCSCLLIRSFHLHTSITYKTILTHRKSHRTLIISIGQFHQHKLDLKKKQYCNCQNKRFDCLTSTKNESDRFDKIWPLISSNGTMWNDNFVIQIQSNDRSFPRICCSFIYIIYYMKYLNNWNNS